jgi:hypothetical protein
MKWLEPAYGLSGLKADLFLQEAADQAVVPVVALAVAQIRAPVEVLVSIANLTEWVAKEQMHHNKINMNINTSSKRQLRARINISRRRDLGVRINIKTNISIGRKPGHRISRPMPLDNLLSYAPRMEHFFTDYRVRYMI